MKKINLEFEFTEEEKEAYDKFVKEYENNENFDLKCCLKRLMVNELARKEYMAAINNKPIGEILQGMLIILEFSQEFQLNCTSVYYISRIEFMSHG